MKPRLAGAPAAFVLYAGLVVWLTWPLAAHLTTHLPNTHGASRFDPLYMAWVLAHESRVLTMAPSRLLDTNIYYPVRGTLFYGDTGFGALPYFMPAFLLTGNPTLALNFLFLSGIALTAWGLHCVVARWTGSQVAGFVAAGTFLVSPWVLWDFVPTAPSYAVLQYWPWIVLVAAIPASRFTRALRLVPLVIAQCLTDLLYVAPAVLVPLGVLALARVARRATRGAGLRLVGVLAMAGLALAPVYAGHIMVAAENPQLSTQTLWRTASSRLALEWQAFATGPTTLQLWSALLILVGAIGFFSDRRQRTVELRRAWTHGLFWAVTGFVLSLPPFVPWHGETITLPLGWLARWAPSLQALRLFDRVGVAMLMGTAVLAGLAFAECARWIQGRGPAGLALVSRTAWTVLVVGAMYTQYARGVGTPWLPRPAPLPASYPLARAITADSPLMALLRAPGGPLLEWPVGSRGQVVTPVFHARAMYRSIYHWRRLLNGYDSYWPPGFPDRMALAGRLPDSMALAALHRETGVELILVVAPEPGVDKVDRSAWVALADRGGRRDLRLIARAGQTLLFAVTPDAGEPQGPLGARWLGAPGP